jgi:hypothetical protein
VVSKKFFTTTCAIYVKDCAGERERERKRERERDVREIE